MYASDRYFHGLWNSFIFNSIYPKFCVLSKNSKNQFYSKTFYNVSDLHNLGYNKKKKKKKKVLLIRILKMISK